MFEVLLRSKKEKENEKNTIFIPISAEVLENQDWHVNLTCQSHVWCPNMTNDTSLESSCALLLESAKKIANLQKLKLFFAKSSYIVTFVTKKSCQKNDKLYIFEKPLTMPFQICKKIC